VDIIVRACDLFPGSGFPQVNKEQTANRAIKDREVLEYYRTLFA
jgi:hypothetical protein